MSQITSYGQIIPPGTYVETLTGNTGGAVGPDGAGNINVVGDGTTVTITGNPGTNTLTASFIGSVGVIDITGDSGAAVTGNVLLKGNGAAAPAALTNSGAVFTGTLGTTQSLTFNYLNIPNATSAGLGAVYYNSTRFMHNYTNGPTRGTFLGTNAGNFSLTSTNPGIGIGSGALSSVTTSTGNIAIGVNCLNANTNGASNVIAIGNSNFISATSSAVSSTVSIGNSNFATITNAASIANVVAIGSTVYGSLTSGTPSNTVAIGSNVFSSVTLGQTSGCVAIGSGAIQTLSSGDVSDTVAVGTGALNVVTGPATRCVAIGRNALVGATSGVNNTAIGGLVAQNLKTGANNLLLGESTGSAYTTSESSNILLQSSGVIGESNALRVGSATGTGTKQLSKAFICGIDGVNVGSVAKVVTMASDQLGTATITAGAGISVTPSANTITIASTGTNTSRPGFSAYLASSVTDVTGDGTQYTIICANATFNQGSNYNTGTGKFTAPSTGFYYFTGNAYLADIGSGHTNGTVQIKTTGGTYYGTLLNVFACQVPAAGLLLNVAVTVPMTAGDTAEFIALVTGSTKTVDVLGQALGSGGITFFSGYQVC